MGMLVGSALALRCVCAPWSGSGDKLRINSDVGFLPLMPGEGGRAGYLIAIVVSIAAVQHPILSANLS